ncbi:interleukin-17 receptor A [Latimeria chalumnae]|uniref:interleukin-17 receptor A n=1 Tax=Latimeria chalumnae TaxID=7897 RepID=UPI00313ED109
MGFLHFWPVFCFLLIYCKCPVTSGAKVLHSPPMSCSQEGVNCTVRNSSCLDISWLRPSQWTPSSPKDLTVKVIKIKSGDTFPVLSIKWKASTDASIRYIQGMEVSVLNYATNERYCIQYDLLNGIQSQVRPNGSKWQFSFERFVAEPGQKYRVTVNNLPKPNKDEDTYNIVKDYTVPDCSHLEMKNTKPCVEKGKSCFFFFFWGGGICLTGSLYEPAISFWTEGDAAIVGFNIDKTSTRYDVFLQSYYSDGQMCKLESKDITANFTQRLNVTFSAAGWKNLCCTFNIMIQPHFRGCQHDCTRYRLGVECPGPLSAQTSKDPNPTAVPPTPNPFIFLVLVGVLLFVVLTSMTVALMLKLRRHSVNEIEMKNFKQVHPAAPSSPPPLTQQKVLLLYSMDHPLYVRIVLKFAEFLATNCGTEVVLDLLQANEVAEVGHLHWLAWQKQEIASLASKVIILCSRGTRAKWQAMLGDGRKKILLREDVRSPMGDMFTPALNLILPDFKRPAAFGKYVVAYFEDVSSERDIPDPFNVSSKYKLMKHFEEVFFRIHDREQHQPGTTLRVQGISADDYFESSSGQGLKSAIQEFAAWQVEHPEWFEQQCVEFEEEALDDLEGPTNVKDPLLPPMGMITQELAYKIPTSAECSVIQILSTEDVGSTFVVEPQFHQGEDPSVSVFQALINPSYSHESYPVHTVEPVSIANSRNTSNQLVPCSGFWSPREVEEPVLDDDLLSRYEVPPSNVPLELFGDLDPGEAAAPSKILSSGLSDAARNDLEGLQRMLFLESFPQVDRRQGPILEGQFVTSVREQSSLQSDQGYVSRSQQLLPQEMVGLKDEEAQQIITSDALSDLRKLQMMMFQEAQQNANCLHAH